MLLRTGDRTTNPRFGGTIDTFAGLLTYAKLTEWHIFRNQLGNRTRDVMRVLIFGLMAVIVGCVEPIDRPENITPTSQPIASFTRVPVQVGVTFTPRPQPSPTIEPTATATRSV